MHKKAKEIPKLSDAQSPLPKSVRRDEAGRILVHLHARPEPVRDAQILRCFPWSVPDQYISLRDADGKEVALVKELDDLDPESRKVVQEELEKKVFNPKILEILDYAHEFGVSSVTARTDRGEVKFQIRSRDDVRLLSPTRALFRDADGNVYELEDLTQLDPVSRKHLSHYF
jgi:hypothetical protein